MPEVRPFRALRYETDNVGDLAAVISPPYDEIEAGRAAELLARHPRNAVRLDLPVDAQGDEPDDRYRRAARTFAAWRSDGTFRKDPKPSLYIYEQADRDPTTSAERARRGFFGRLRLEPFGPDAGVIAIGDSTPAARDDRYKLLRATGVNTSPIVGRYPDPAGQVDRILAATTRTSPIVDLVDDSGVRHRMWALAAEGPDADNVAAIVATVGASPVQLVDGQHRYDSAVRYRDERRMSRSCEEDPAFDYILTLFVAAPAAEEDPLRPPTGLVINPHEW